MNPSPTTSPNSSPGRTSEANRAKAERLKEMLATKYSKQKAETESMTKRRIELEQQMASMNLNDAQKNKYRYVLCV